MLPVYCCFIKKEVNVDHTSRRRFLKQVGAAGSLFLGGGALMSGCSAPGSSAGAKRTLNFWAFSDTRIAWQKHAFDLYKQQFKPDFEINWLILPYNQMHDKVMITAQAQSGGPDIADIEISQFSRFIKGDVIFVDITPKLQQRNLLDKFYRASATDPWSWQDKVYGLGNELNTCLMSYRWDIYEKAGIQTPIETWDDFVEKAKKFHQDTGNVLIDMAYTDWGQWWMMTLQQGGGFFGPDGQPTLDAPPGIDTLAWMKRGITDGWSILHPTGQGYNVALGSGAIASLLGPSWQFSGFTQQNLPKTAGKWHLQPFPRWVPNGSRTATWGGTGVCVLKTSDMADEASDFVIWEHTSPEALLFDFKERQVWPTFKPAFDNPALNQPIPFFDNQRVGDLIKEVSPEINKWYNSPYWPETTDACVRVGITPALQTAQPADSALAAAQQAALKIITFESA
jgi:arabinosaccharide transport system substrate-binding protein